MKKQMVTLLVYVMSSFCLSQSDFIIIDSDEYLGRCKLNESPKDIEDSKNFNEESSLLLNQRSLVSNHSAYSALIFTDKNNNNLSYMEDAYISEKNKKIEEMSKEVHVDVKKLERKLLTEEFISQNSENEVSKLVKKIVSIKIKSIFVVIGARPEYISGILANFIKESGMDFSAIEAVFGEKYFLGPKKEAAMKDLNSFTVDFLFKVPHKYPLNKEGYFCPEDGKYYPGIGAAQYTGPSAKRLIDYAESHNENWWDMDTQLQYAFDPEGYMYLQAPSNVKERYKIFSLINFDFSPYEAAINFNDEFQGMNLDNHLKGSHAEEIFMDFHKIPVDYIYGEKFWESIGLGEKIKEESLY